MRSTERFQILSRLYKPLLLVVSLLVLWMTISAILTTNTVNAQSAGVVGGGGSGGAGGAGAHGKYGWGWFMYPVSGNPYRPYEEFRDGYTWSQASGRCSAAGADTVVAFVLLDHDADFRNNNPNHGKVYEYYLSGGGGLGVKSNPSKNMALYYGNGWLMPDAAKALFDTLPASARIGWSWGGSVGENNVAWFCYSNRQHWRIDGYSGIKKANSTTVSADSGWSGAKITAHLSETIYWKHTLTARDARIDSTVSWRLEGNGFPASFRINNTGSVSAANNIQANQVFARLGKYPGANPSYTVYTPTDDDVGKDLCQRISWAPVSWNNGSRGASEWRCVNILYDYSLTPSVTLSRSHVEPGGEFTVQGRVDNEGTIKEKPGAATKSRPIEWQLSYVVIRPGGQKPSGAISSTNPPCTQYRGANVTCSAGPFTSGGAASGGGLVIPKEGHTFQLRYATAPDFEVGTKLCYGLSVKDRAHNSATWRHSNLECMVVSKRPTVRVMGGDLLVGRNGASSNVRTNAKSVGGRMYGSYGEYAIIASGLVTNMASAAGYAGGVEESGLLIPCSVSKLTFSNRPTATGACAANQLGRFSFGGEAPGVASRFPISTSTPTLPTSGQVRITDHPAQTVYRAAGSLTATTTINLASATIPVGSWYVINAPNSDVIINGNLTYQDTAAISSPSQIPQLVIIARNIIIHSDVTRVDAWLIASGTGSHGRINTCGAGAGITESTQPTASRCNALLRVNGPVIANRLLMKRTAGAGTGARSGDPAEVFNLRPDAYLWATAINSGTTKASTSFTKELPPRY